MKLKLIFPIMVLLLLLSVWTVSAAKGYKNGRLWIVHEPDTMSPYVNCYSGKKQIPQNKLTWQQNGYSGRCVSLNGAGQYLEVGYWQLQIHKMTVAGWFYWRGAADGQDKQSMYSQRLFTLSHNDNTYLTLMPHAKNPEKKDKDGKILDGVYMEFSMGDKKDRVKYELYNPAEPGKESFGLSQNKWHHVAVTMDGQYLKLYIDGHLRFEQLLVLGVEEMRNNMLTIGFGRWGDPTLNALIDELAIYDYAMTIDDIKALCSAPPNPASSLTKTITTAGTVSKSTTKNSDIFGLPSWTVWTVGGLIITFVALSVVLSIYNKPDNSKKDRYNP
ncbi:MAG: LamG domain-containing protein [Oscillospiraceae bacterium]|nr:LamG domain-containing protein [Oscillospiraceae bacterium]